MIFSLCGAGALARESFDQLEILLLAQKVST